MCIITVSINKAFEVALHLRTNFQVLTKTTVKSIMFIIKMKKAKIAINIKYLSMWNKSCI
jgi:hypothetical protein